MVKVNVPDVVWRACHTIQSVSRRGAFAPRRKEAAPGCSGTSLRGLERGGGPKGSAVQLCVSERPRPPFEVRSALMISVLTTHFPMCTLFRRSVFLQTPVSSSPLPLPVEFLILASPPSQPPDDQPPVQLSRHQLQADVSCYDIYNHLML